MDNAQPEIVAAMLDPSFYPHRPGRVELRETHTSWVFLADELAFKVKKPVVLPFLDYGSPDRRHRMCSEEVRLNRRLAPGYYLGVEAISRKDGRFALVPEDDPGAIEYVVRMRRVPEARTLASLAGRGRVEEGDVGAVARRLARFHVQAPRAPAEFEDLSLLEGSLRENIETLGAGVPSVIPHDRLRAAGDFTEAFLEKRRPDLVERARKGWIRECHGDLRAEHVIVADGIDVYDCVEFNLALRFIDVAADIAFLVMDLTRLASFSLADRLVAAYRDAGGDPGDDDLLSFYAAYRAWVRSKVACVRAAELPEADPERDRKEAEARALLELGHRFAWRARLPLVLVVCGPAAAGKTTLAKRVAEVSGLEHLSSDATRKRLAGLAPTEPATADHYTDTFNRRTYEELGRLAADQVRRGGGVIVDATFRRRVDREAFAAALGDITAPVFFAACEAPADVLRERARGREAEREHVSDAGPDVAARQLAEFEALSEVPEGLRSPVRTDRPVGHLLPELEDRVNRLLG
jgi:uncharacterized protein